MAFICIPKEKVEAFKQALRDKSLKLEDLLDPKMTSEARTKIFEEYTKSPADAKAINTLFEEKLVLKNRMLGIANLFSKMGEIGKYSDQGKIDAAKAMSDYKAAQQERIFSPKEHEAFLNDLADKKLGVHVSQDVAQKVFDLSQKAQALKDVNPGPSGQSDEYINAKKDLNKYVESQKPVSAFRQIMKNLGGIFRNHILMNPSIPIKALDSQVTNYVTDYITRRISTLSANGLVSDMVKEDGSRNWQTFRNTGVNTLSMEGPNDFGKLGEGKNFDVQGGMESSNPIVKGIETGTRKYNQITTKVAIDFEHNQTYTKIYQKTFLDTDNIMSSKVAEGDVAKTREIFTDAQRIEPQTPEGKYVRAESQYQAGRVTATNTTWAGKLSLDVKDWANKWVPGLGDILAPIAKIGATTVSNLIENAGPGILMGIKDIFQGKKLMASDDITEKLQGMNQFANGYQKVVRTVGVMSAAAFFASQLTKNDFKKDNYGDNFVRIGGQWVNMEYIPVVSTALAGMMSVKMNAKSNQGILATATQYTAGVANSLKKLPVIDELNTIVTDLSNPTYNKGIGKYIANFAASRTVPAFIQNFLKDRPINRLLFGASGMPDAKELAKLKATK